MENAERATGCHFRAIVAAMLAFLTLCGTQVCAQTAAPTQGGQYSNPIVQYFADWFPRVTRIQSEQPHWVTPLVTVTPRLEEEVRYDQFFQAQQYGHSLDNFGG